MILIWIFTIFVFFQLVQTKYITYTYPLLFPLSLLVGEYLERNIDEIKFASVIIYNTIFYCLLIGAIAWFDIQKSFNISTIFLVVLLLITAFVSAYTEQLYFYNKKRKIVFLLASFAIFFNYLLISQVAVPFSNIRSAKSVAEAIQGLKPYQNESVVYAYGRYPTSAVFYLGKEFDTLIKRENIEKFKPKPFDWSSKNVMPYYELEKLAKKDEKSLIVMKNRAFKRFENEKIGKWNLVFKTKNGWGIFQKEG
jgi:4-amino-4-deoxy-L-arabinose transferase-like glycosyltransferase